MKPAGPSTLREANPRAPKNTRGAVAASVGIAATKNLSPRAQPEAAMSNKEQAEFFSRLYDDEASRGATLLDRAKWYLSLITFFSTATLFVVEKLRPQDFIQLSIFILAIVGMMASFLASLWAVRVDTFEAISDPDDALTKMQENRFDDVKFFLDRISDYVVATERNSKVHDCQANALSIAGYLMLAGMAAQCVYFTIRLVPVTP
jgi:hypothetical protein